MHDKVNSTMVTDMFNFLPMLLRLMHLSLENHENRLGEEDEVMREKAGVVITDLLKAAYQTQS